MIPTNVIFAEKIVQHEGGVYDLLGVANRVYVPTFPARVHVMMFMTWRVTEGARTKDSIVTIHITRPNGQDLVTLTANYDLSASQTPDGRQLAYIDSPLGLTINFPEAGKYTFDIRHNGASWRRVPFFVKDITSQE